MNFQKILVPVVGVMAVVLAYGFYGWLGVAVVAFALVIWVLLHFARMMQALKRAASRPMGHVDSAVMLNAKLKPGMSLPQVIAMTRALGKLQSDKGAQPEVFLLDRRQRRAGELHLWRRQAGAPCAFQA